jgi:hypothetical protein
MLRSTSRALPFAAVCILGAGCGSNHNPTASSTTAASGSITKAQATAYAREVNLSSTDLPVAKATSPEHEGSAESQAGVEFARCAAAVNPSRRVASIKSVALAIGSTREPAQVRSSVEVLPTAVLAAQNYAAIHSARGRACLARRLPLVLGSTAKRRFHFGPVTVTFPPSLLPTGQQSFGVHLSTTVIGKSIRGTEIRTPFYADLFALLAGPTEINLSAFGFYHPVSTATERRLLSLLYSRAEAHKL